MGSVNVAAQATAPAHPTHRDQAQQRNDKHAQAGHRGEGCRPLEGARCSSAHHAHVSNLGGAITAVHRAVERADQRAMDSISESGSYKDHGVVACTRVCKLAE